MAFKLYSTDDGHVPAWEYLPCSAMKPQIGMGLAVNETTGLLAVSTTPKYIAMRVEDKNVASGTLIPVVKIAPDQVWESALASAANVKAGKAVDVASGGLLVDATATANKNFTLTYLAGTAEGSAVRGRFNG